MLKQPARYRITNWQAYNKSLIKRGDISIWLCPGVLKGKNQGEGKKQRGRPKRYSDGLIEMSLMAKHLYHLPYRATEGFMNSLFRELKLKGEVPSYSQLSRRAEEVKPKLKRLFNCKGQIDIAVDSTGLKVYGEGEWKVRKHGIGKRRTWRKLHLAVDPLDHEIIACELTENGCTDEETLPKILHKINDKIDRCLGDGAYDKKRCYKSCYERQIQLITPPMKRAKVQPGKLPELYPRDEAIRRIEVLSKRYGGDEERARAQWKLEVDYHSRSLAETAMYRFKTLFTDKLTSRKIRTQQTEMMIKVNLMNRFTALGMPVPQVVYA